MPRLAAALAALAVTGCASGPSVNAPPDPVHSRAPQNYEAVVSNYFELAMPDAPAGHKLVFGSPELSDCTLYAPGGRHLSWVVPVVEDPDHSAHAAARPVGRREELAARRVKGDQGRVSLDEVSVRGTRYFFWFSNDTIGAVTRRADLCP